MRSGYLLLSLLLACALGTGSATFIIGTSAGVATAAVALGAAALIGVGALGVGAAFASRGGGRRRGGRGRGGRGGGRRHRGRRDASLEELEEEEDSNMWDMVNTNDQAGCARKLICLLEAAEGKVDEDEQLILAFLGDLKDLSKTQRASKVPYETAGWLGKLRGAKSCEAAFGASCPYSRENMMGLIKTIWSGALPASPEA